ncbi:hypothetical protein MMC19_004127 [Ptychographa xylographoides]|nr:hypothetical protein [Ptychographa xylographoides]
MVQLLLVRRTRDMLVQGTLRREPAVAEIALIAVAVPRLIHTPGVFMPLQEVLRDDTTLIALLQSLEDAFTVDTNCVGAGTCFEVVGNAASCDKVALAKRAREVGALMDTRIFMLKGNRSIKLLDVLLDSVSGERGIWILHGVGYSRFEKSVRTVYSNGHNAGLPDSNGPRHPYAAR